MTEQGRRRRHLVRSAAGLAVALVAAAGIVAALPGSASAASAAPIKGVASGRCIDVPGSNSTNGTQVELWDCNGGANQQFTVTSNQYQVLGKCLDATGYGRTQGTTVELWDCTGGANQQWRLDSSGNLVGVDSGLCLDATGAGTANGTLLQLWGCNGAGNQHWTTSATSGTGTSTGSSGKNPAGGQALHVSGGKIMTASGQPYRLLGVNRSGGEFACIQGNGFWSNNTDQASVNALKTWNIHTVRIPMNEQCWLGTSNVDSRYRGTNYQNAVKSYVNLLLANNITPLLELHWSAGTYTGPSSGCSDFNATCQKPMPDAQYAPTFWTQVANAYKDNRVVFEPFNEPYPDRAAGSDTWRCWRDGGTCTGIGYKVAGMQTLLDAIRNTGNTNVVTIGGVAYSSDLTGWLSHMPTDKTGNLGASEHLYNFSGCSQQSCWDSQLAPVAAKVPLTLTEIGQDKTTNTYMPTVFPWADSHNVGYLGWTWNTWDSACLVTDENGDPTAAGSYLKAHLLTQ